MPQVQAPPSTRGRSVPANCPGNPSVITHASLLTGKSARFSYEQPLQRQPGLRRAYAPSASASACRCDGLLPPKNTSGQMKRSLITHAVPYLQQVQERSLISRLPRVGCAPAPAPLP